MSRLVAVSKVTSAVPPGKAATKPDTLIAALAALVASAAHKGHRPPGRKAAR